MCGLLLRGRAPTPMAPSTPTWVQTHCTAMLLRCVAYLGAKLKPFYKNLWLNIMFCAAWRLQRLVGDPRGREAGGEIG